MSSLLPPRWKDLESDERYSQLAPTQRLQVFNKWLTDASSYGTQNGWWEDEQTATNFKNLVKTKLPELSQAVYEENKIGGFEDVKDATARAGYGLAGAPRRLNQFATDTLLGVSRAIDYVPGLVADGLNKVFGTELKVDSWLTNQLRSISQTNQASIDALQEKSRALDGGELGELADQFATAGADAVVDVGAAMATGGVSIPGTLAKRSPGVFRGVLDDLVESFTGPSGRQMRIASTLGAGRSYSGTWNDAIREYTDMGFSREEAEAKATPEALNAGAATYLITMLGGTTGVESVLKDSGAQGLRGRLREVLTETASEGLEEGADQSLQDLNERFTRNPDKTVEDSFKEIKYAVGLGALLGGGFSAVGQTVEQLRASDAPETAKALETGWWETPEKTAQRVAQVKEEIDAKFGPDDSEDEATMEILQDLESKSQTASTEDPTSDSTLIEPVEAQAAPEEQKLATVAKATPEEESKAALQKYQRGEITFDELRRINTQLNQNVRNAARGEGANALQQYVDESKLYSNDVLNLLSEYAGIEAETLADVGEPEKVVAWLKRNNIGPKNRAWRGRELTPFEDQTAGMPLFNQEPQQPSQDTATQAPPTAPATTGAPVSPRVPIQFSPETLSKQSDEEFTESERVVRGVITRLPDDDPRKAPAQAALVNIEAERARRQAAVSLAAPKPAPAPRTLDQFTDEELDQEATILERQAESETDAVRLEEINTQIKTVAAERQRRTAPPAPTAPPVASPPAPVTPVPASSASGVTNTQDAFTLTGEPAPSAPRQQQPAAPRPAVTESGDQGQLPLGSGTRGANREVNLTEGLRASGVDVTKPSEALDSYKKSLVDEARGLRRLAPLRNVDQVTQELEGQTWVPSKFKSPVMRRKFARQLLDEARATRAEELGVGANVVVQGSEVEGTVYKEVLDSGKVLSARTIYNRLVKEAAVGKRTGNPQKDAAREEKLESIRQQARAIEAEANRLVATNLGIPNPETVVFAPDFTGKNTLPQRVVSKGKTTEYENIFVNDPDITARQIDSGMQVTIPKDQRDSVSDGIVFNRRSGKVTSAVTGNKVITEAGQLRSEKRKRVKALSSTFTIPEEAASRQEKLVTTIREFDNETQSEFGQVIRKIEQANIQLPAEFGPRVKAVAMLLAGEAYSKGKKPSANTVLKQSYRKFWEKISRRPEIMELSLDMGVDPNDDTTWLDIVETADDAADVDRKEGGRKGERAVVRNPKSNLSKMISGMTQADAQRILAMADQKFEFGEVLTPTERALYDAAQEFTMLQDQLRKGGRLTDEPGGKKVAEFTYADLREISGGTPEIPGTELPPGAFASAESKVSDDAAEVSDEDIAYAKDIIEEAAEGFPAINELINAGVKGYLMYVRGDSPGTVYVNLAGIAQTIQGIDRDTALAYVKKVFNHETRHLALLRALTVGEITAIGQSLSQVQLREAAESYFNKSEFASEEQRQAEIEKFMANPTLAAMEYVTILSERIQSGASIQDIGIEDMPVTILEKIVEALRAILNQLRTRMMLRQPGYEALAIGVERLEEGIRLLEEDLTLGDRIAAANEGGLFAAAEGSRAELIEKYLANKEAQWSAVNKKIEEVENYYAQQSEPFTNVIKERLKQIYPGTSDRNLDTLINDIQLALSVETTPPDADYINLNRQLGGIDGYRLGQRMVERLRFGRNSVSAYQSVPLELQGKEVTVNNARNAELVGPVAIDGPLSLALVKFADGNQQLVPWPSIVITNTGASLSDTLSVEDVISVPEDKVTGDPDPEIDRLLERLSQYNVHADPLRSQLYEAARKINNDGPLSESELSELGIGTDSPGTVFGAAEGPLGVDDNGFLRPTTDAQGRRAYRVTINGVKVETTAKDPQIAARNAVFQMFRRAKQVYFEGQTYTSPKALIVAITASGRRIYKNDWGRQFAKPAVRRIPDGTPILPATKSEQAELPLIFPSMANPAMRVRVGQVNPEGRPKGGFWDRLKLMVRGRYSETKKRTGGISGSGAATPLERDAMIAQQARIKGTIVKAESIVKNYRRERKKHKDFTDEQINAALGTTENPYTDAQVKELNKIKDAKAKEAKREEFRKVNAATDRLVRQQALSQLPGYNPKFDGETEYHTGLAKAVEDMRIAIDEMSQALMAGDYIPAALKPRVEQNLNVYVHRSYTIFDNPEWKRFMLEPQTDEHRRVQSRAVRLFQKYAVAEIAQELRAEAEKAGASMSQRDALRLASRERERIATRAGNMLVEYLSIADDRSNNFFVTGELPGQRKLDIIKVRGQIPKEIRELWGEIQKADDNFVKTMSKMAGYMSATDTARELVRIGLEQKYMWKQGVSKGERPAGFHLIYRKGDANPASVSPLEDVYAPAEVGEFMRSFRDHKTMYGWARQLAFMTAGTMAMKTIGNFPQGYVRNFFGNPFIMVNGGYINPAHPTEMFKAAKQAFKLALTSSGLRNNEAIVKSVSELTSAGLIGEGVDSGLMREMTDTGFGDLTWDKLYEAGAYETAMRRAARQATGATRNTFEFFARIYQGVDDFWKVFAYEMEKFYQRRTHPDWSEAQISKEAIDRVRNKVPTYSLSPELTRNIRSIPFIAPFITWTSETIRTSANNLAIAAEDIRVGRETKNPQMVRNGWRAIRGFAFALGAFPTLAMISKAIFGYDDEDEDAYREGLPEWEQNASLVFLGKAADGTGRHWNASFLDPYQSRMEGPIAFTRAMRNGDAFTDALVKGGMETLRPLLSEQLLFGAITSILRNRTAQGKPIYNEQDTAFNKTRDTMGYLALAAGPGTIVGAGRRLYLATQGTVLPTGQTYDVGNELLGMFGGQKVSSIDFRTTLNRAKNKYASSRTEATQLFSRVFSSQGSVDLQDIGPAYENAVRAHRELQEEMMRAFDNAIRMGVPRKDAIQILRGSMGGAEVSKEDLRAILRGEPRRWTPSGVSLDAAKTGKIPDGRARLKALRDYIRSMK